MPTWRCTAASQISPPKSHWHAHPYCSDIQTSLLLSKIFQWKILMLYKQCTSIAVYMNPHNSHSPSPDPQTWLFALFSFSPSCRPVLLGQHRDCWTNIIPSGTTPSAALDIGTSLPQRPSACLKNDVVSPFVWLMQWPLRRLHGQGETPDFSSLCNTVFPRALPHLLLEPLLCSCMPRSVLVGNLRNLPAWQSAEKPLKELGAPSSRRPCACVPLFSFTLPFLIHAFLLFLAGGCCGT